MEMFQMCSMICAHCTLMSLYTHWTHVYMIRYIKPIMISKTNLSCRRHVGINTPYMDLSG